MVADIYFIIKSNLHLNSVWPLSLHISCDNHRIQLLIKIDWFLQDLRMTFTEIKENLIKSVVTTIMFCEINTDRKVKTLSQDFNKWIYHATVCLASLLYHFSNVTLSDLQRYELHRFHCTFDSKIKTLLHYTSTT